MSIWPSRAERRRQRTERDVARRAAAHQRAHDRAMAFEQCATCSYDLRTGEGERACHYYACPYLPEELDVFCPQCNYDFFTGEGDAECGDPPHCRYARVEAPRRVAALREWTAEHATKAP